MSVPFPAPEGPVTTKTGPGDGITRNAATTRECSTQFVRPETRRRRMSGSAVWSRPAVEEIDELVALALGETADRLRLADAALIE